MGCIALGVRAKTKSSQMGCLRAESKDSKTKPNPPRWGASGLNQRIQRNYPPYMGCIALGVRAKTKSSLEMGNRVADLNFLSAINQRIIMPTTNS